MSVTPMPPPPHTSTASPLPATVQAAESRINAIRAELNQPDNDITAYATLAQRFYQSHADAAHRFCAALQLALLLTHSDSTDKPLTLIERRIAMFVLSEFSKYATTRRNVDAVVDNPFVSLIISHLTLPTLSASENERQFVFTLITESSVVAALTPMDTVKSVLIDLTQIKHITDFIQQNAPPPSPFAPRGNSPPPQIITSSTSSSSSSPSMTPPFSPAFPSLLRPSRTPPRLSRPTSMDLNHKSDINNAIAAQLNSHQTWAKSNEAALHEIKEMSSQHDDAHERARALHHQMMNTTSSTNSVNSMRDMPRLLDRVAPPLSDAVHSLQLLLNKSMKAILSAADKQQYSQLIDRASAEEVMQLLPSLTPAMMPTLIEKNPAVVTATLYALLPVVDCSDFLNALLTMDVSRCIQWSVSTVCCSRRRCRRTSSRNTFTAQYNALTHSRTITHYKRDSFVFSVSGSTRSLDQVSVHRRYSQRSQHSMQNCRHSLLNGAELKKPHNSIEHLKHYTHKNNTFSIHKNDMKQSNILIKNFNVNNTSTINLLN